MIDKVKTAAEAAKMIRSGMHIGVGSGMEMNPMPVIREAIKNGVVDLTLTSVLTGGYVTDLLIGAGCVSTVQFPQIRRSKAISRATRNPVDMPLARVLVAHSQPRTMSQTPITLKQRPGAFGRAAVPIGTIYLEYFHRKNSSTWNRSLPPRQMLRKLISVPIPDRITRKLIAISRTTNMPLEIRTSVVKPACSDALDCLYAIITARPERIGERFQWHTDDRFQRPFAA